MKKSFALTDPKINSARLVEAIKGEIRKYLKRERRKKLPDAVDFWDFDCRVGLSEADAATVHVTELGRRVEALSAGHASSCYVEILAKRGYRQKTTDSKGRSILR